VQARCQSDPCASQINSLSELAVTYNNQSILENHHAATLFRMLLQAPLQAAAQPRHDAAFRVSTPTDGTASHPRLLPSPPAHNALGLPRAVFAQVHSYHMSRAALRTPDGQSTPLQFRRIAVAGILGTDMARHPQVVDTLRSLSSGAGFSESTCRTAARAASCSPDVLAPSPEELSALLLHAADLSAPLCPDFAVAYEWSERCYAEFSSQVIFCATGGSG